MNPTITLDKEALYNAAFLDSQINSINKKFEEDITKKNNQIIQYEEEIKKLEDELGTIKSQLYNYNLLNDNKKFVISGSASLIRQNQYSNTMNILNDSFQKKALQLQIEALKKNKEQNEEEITKLKHEINEIKKTHNQEINELKKDHQKKINEINLKNQTLIEKNNSLQKENQALSDQNDQNNKKIQGLNKLIKKYESIISESNISLLTDNQKTNILELQKALVKLIIQKVFDDFSKNPLFEIKSKFSLKKNEQEIIVDNDPKKDPQKENFFTKSYKRIFDYFPNLRTTDFIESAKQKFYVSKEYTFKQAKKVYKICDVLLNLGKADLSFSLKNCILALVALTFLWLFLSVSFLVKVIIILCLTILFKIVDENYGVMNKVNQELNNEENEKIQKEKQVKIDKIKKENDEFLKEIFKELDQDFQKLNVIIKTVGNSYELSEILDIDKLVLNEENKNFSLVDQILSGNVQVYYIEIVEKQQTI